MAAEKKMSGGVLLVAALSGLCLISIVVVSAPYVALVLACGSGVYGGLILAGRVHRGRTDRLSMGILVIVGSVVLAVCAVAASGTKQDAERNQQTAEKIRKAQEAAAVRRRAERDAELRKQAPIVVQNARQALESAKTQLAKKDYKGIVSSVNVPRARLAELAQLQPPIEDTHLVYSEINNLYEEAKLFVTAGEYLGHAEMVLEKKFDDPVDAEETYQTALTNLDTIQGKPLEEKKRKIQAASRRLRAKLDRVKDAAFDGKLAKEIAKEGMTRVSAKVLFNDFNSNEVVAEERYRGRKLAVDGNVDNISTNAFGTPTIHLKTSNMFMSVHAKMKSRGDAAQLRPRDRVLLRCIGSIAIVGDVFLNDCSTMAYWR